MERLVDWFKWHYYNIMLKVEAHKLAKVQHELIIEVEYRAPKAMRDFAVASGDAAEAVAAFGEALQGYADAVEGGE